MQRGNSSEITFLVEDLEAVLEMNRLLEKENQELKHEVSRLKAQVASLKAHDLERKSILWKKLQQQQKQATTETTTAEQNSVLSEPASKKLTAEPTTATKKLNQQNPLPKGPPPPPPPLPSKALVGSRFTVKRMPEVIEFYRYLNKRNTQLENRTNVTGTSPGEGNNPRNMIGEIENRSTHLSAVKSDVETQREFILFLIRKVETAAFKEISAVESFVKWLDEELSCLVDERAVLKHFPQWPERKADAFREAACTYRDFKILESEVVSYKDNPKLPLSQTLGHIQALQDRRVRMLLKRRLERAINNTERSREGTCKRYKELQIPWDWMQDTGLLGQVKLSSLKLAKEYLRRVIKELQGPKCPKLEDIMLQGARFAYRVHQFAGGFDVDTKRLFEDLKQIHSRKLLQDHQAPSYING